MYPPDAAVLLGAMQAWGAGAALASWDAAKPCKQWAGVVCDANGRASALNLTSYGLTGSIPSNFGTLIGLQYLTLSKNQLSGSLPFSLGNLTSLQSLDLSANQLNGSLPSNMGSMGGLNYLDLYNNQFTGSLPSSFSTALQSLDLSYNQLSGTLPSGIFTTGLTYLALGFNHLSGPLPSSLGTLSALQSLGLSTNQLSGSLPSGLGFMTGLSSLDLSTNQLSGCIPTNLGSSSALQLLNFSSNPLNGTIPSSLGNLLSLTSLDLSTNQLNGSIPSTLGNLLSLQYLDLSVNTLSGSIPAGIYLLTNLTSLVLKQNQLSGSLASSIGVLTVLVTLDLSQNQLSGPIPSSLGLLTAVTNLDLSANQLTGTLPSSIGNLVGLHYVTLYYNQLTGPIPSSIGNLTAVLALDLSANQLSGFLPASLANLTGLTSFSGGNNQLSGSLPLNLGNMTSLSNFDVSYNRLSGGIPSSISSLTGLTKLDLSGNNLAGSVPDGIGNMPVLQYLSLFSNQLTGSLPSTLGTLTSLVTLMLNSNQLSGSLPSTIGALTALSFLFLDVNSFEGSIPDQLGSLTALAHVTLDHNRFTGTIPSTLSQLTSTNVTMPSNLLTGPLPALPPGYLGQWDFSDNLLFGSCPQILDTCDLTDYPCIAPLASTFLGNCFQDCSVGSIFTVKQRSEVECAYACGSDQAIGPCLGQGTCLISGPNNVAACVCNPGFVSPPSNPGTCVPATAAAAPPPPPAPDVNYSQGVTFLQHVPTRALNRWSRYLSTNYKPQNGVPRWIIASDSAWMAPGSAFLGYNPLTAGVTGILKWWATRDQGACAACWAAATTDAVAAAQTIAASSAGGSVPLLSVQQVLGCSANGTSGSCSGDYPTTALEYAAGSAILNDASFLPGGSCANIPPPPAIIMYETVQFRGWFGLLLTLQKQPAVVVLEAGDCFQQETCMVKNLVFQDPSCYSGNLDHSVLVVGYDISNLYPYWVIRNSWGPSWCNGGYMRLAIQGGSGVCGMNVLPAYYPVAAPPAGDPCYTTSAVPDGDNVPAFNPCGGGTCKPAPAWGVYSYTCTCPTDFVPVNNTVTVTLTGAGQGITQTCAPVDACGLTLTNPCSVGTCVNDGRGSYSCLCPIGYFNDTTADGQSTCSFGSAPTQLTVQPGVTCCLISASYNITIPQLLRQNPGLNCSALNPGQVVNTSNPSFSCAVAYTVTSDYLTFDSIAGTVLRPSNSSAPGISSAQLRALNPTATCSAGGQLAKGQVICLRAGTWQGPPTCNNLYTMQAVDTCTAVTDSYFFNDPIPFYAMNPGLDCGVVTKPGPGADSGVRATGVTVCVGSEPVGRRLCPLVMTLKKTMAATTLYVGTKGDNCMTIRSNKCKRFNDRTLFGSEAFLSINKVPDCRSINGFQFCCP